MKTFAPLFLSFFALLIPLSAFSLTPPVSSSDMKSEADFILKGKIAHVECEPKEAKKFACGTTFFYRAFLNVSKIVKQPKENSAPKTAIIYFSKRRYNRGCTGDQDHFHLPGESGTYYLRHIKNGDMTLINWSTVEIEKEGDRSKVTACPRDALNGK